MSTADLCDVCERRPATHTCRQCGASVCGKHYDEERGLCSQCLGTLTGVEDLSELDRPERVDDDDLLR